MPLVQAERAVPAQLLDRIARARQQSDEVFELLQPSVLYERPIPERHRVIFYLGHLESFDWNLLHSRLDIKSFHAEFDRLFAFGIDPVGGGLPSDQPSDWPSLPDVREYRAKIRRTLDEKIANELRKPRIETSEGFSLDTSLNVAIEHRLMHVETLAYMLHQLPFDKKVARARNQPVQRTSLATDSPASHSPTATRMIEIPAGMVTLGLSRDGQSFGWDNEYEMHETFVPAFEIDEFMVSNRQYLDFIAAGGYETRAFWSDPDWNWKSAQGISHPVFWNKSNGAWVLRLMFEEVPLPLDWPVYVSQAEAAAYARWAEKALPTEAEWRRAAHAGNGGHELLRPWENDSPARANGNIDGNYDFNCYDPVPVNAFPENRSSFGVHGMLGNGWEWTSTVFAAFPGFKPFPFYPGYSADFFDGKHFVMKGGSARTAACMLRPTFRNWFQSHYQYVYAGIRCVRR
jgi:iron(II)-dependent oxidoreductase